MDNSFIIDRLSSDIATAPAETVTFLNTDGSAYSSPAIGTVVFGILSKDRVLNLLGFSVGEKSGTGVGSSLVFTTDVMDSTLEVAWDYSKNGQNAQITNMLSVIAGLTAGAWTLEYNTGLLIVKAKTTGTTQAITSYKIRKQPVSDVTLVTGDIEIGAVELKNASTDDRAKVSTAGADGVSNTQNQLEVGSRPSGYNGTTWDRLRSGITAVTSTLTGWLNVLPWAVFNTTPSTRTNGQGGPLEADANGNLLTSMGTKIAGEDQSADVLKVEEQYSPTFISTATTTTSKSGAGRLHTINIMKTLAGAVDVYDNTAGSGTKLASFAAGTTPGTYILDATLNSGCTTVTASADTVQLNWR